MKGLVLSALFLLGVTVSFSQDDQDVVVNQSGSYTSCGGSFIDSGGEGGTGYSNGENYTVTICPSVPGDVVTVDFVTFNLDQSGPENTWDSMSIFDGDNTTAGTLGTYTGNALQGLFVTATPLNDTGCLTFVFNSNGTGTGSYGGGITCDTPCDRPIAEATSSVDDDNRICVGEEVTFDGSASTAADGFNIVEYEWDFADGTPFEYDPIVTHSFAEPGEYIVELYLLDDNGCASTNRVSIQVLVATYPDFDPFPGDTTLCFGEVTGEEACLIAAPDLYEVTWSGPEVTYEQSEDTPLPDNVGECFQSEIEVAGFGPGQTLQDVNDLMAINISIEHTWLFDLVISISCPSGQNVILHQQMQDPDGGTVNSNGTDLGAPPEFWDYTWSNDADLGTWSQEAQNANGSLPEGVYSSLQPLDGLVGCDLNGTWTFEICDLWGGDDGTLDYWGLEFNPAIIPDVTEFTPEIGTDADSSFWTLPAVGLDVISQSADGNEVCLLATTPGDYEYMYTVTNNHGCTHDTTVTVTVSEPVMVDAGTNVTLCGGDATQLEASILGTAPPSDCEYTIEMFDTFGDGWNGFNIDVVIDGVTEYNFTIDAGDYAQGTFVVPSGETFEIIMNDGAFQFEVEYEIYDSDGNLIFADNNGVVIGLAYTGVGLCNGLGDFSFDWAPAEGLDDPNIFNPTLVDAQPGIYNVSMYPNGHPVCAFSDQVEVLSAYDFEISSVSPICETVDDGQIYFEVDETTGVGPWDVTITQDNNQIFNDPGNMGEPVTLTDLPPAMYVVTVSDPGGCSYDTPIDMPQPAPIILETSPDTTVCIGGTAAIWASSVLDANNLWTYTWTEGAGDQSAVNVTPDATTNYSVTALTPQGCSSTPANVLVSLYNPLNAVIPNDTLVCNGGTVNVNVSNFSGGNGEAYFWEWTLNDAPLEGQVNSFTINPTETGVVCLVLSDACESPTENICMNAVIESPLNPVFSSSSPVGCAPHEVTFINPNDPSTYSSQVWDLGEGLIVVDQVPTYTYNLTGSFDVSLVLTSNIGCVYEHSAPGYINVSPPPIANFFATPQPTRFDETEIEFYDTSIGEVASYEWVFDSLQFLGTSVEPNPVFTFPEFQAGTYPVTLTVTDPYGCQSTVTIDVIISELFNLWIPTAFTPNQDGINDVWFMQGTDIDPNKFEVHIFNRWGQVIYHSTDINDPWVGDVNNGEYYAPDGVYTYRIVAHSLATDERQEFTGNLTIMR